MFRRENASGAKSDVACDSSRAPLMKIPLFCLLASASLLLAAPEETTHMAGRTLKAPGPPGYMDVQDKDKAMDRAVDEAHKSLGFFVAALQAKKPDTHDFEIKAAFIDGEKAEHLWIDQVRWDGKVFHGRVNNQPLDVRSARLGQRVKIEPKDVSDWMFVKGDKLMGGFTTRVLYARLSPEEKAQFVKMAEFKID